MDKTALYPLSYGLYVIGVKNDFCEFGGCVVDALMQISSGNTPQIAVSCMKNNNTPAMIKKYGKFTVSVLGREVDLLPHLFRGEYAFGSNMGSQHESLYCLIHILA